MPERGQFISDEDFLALKSLIDAEIGRRGKTEGTAQGQSVGSMAAYRGTAYQYNVTPADGVSVDAEHIQKITRLVDAVQGGATTPARGDQVQRAMHGALLQWLQHVLYQLHRQLWRRVRRNLQGKLCE